MSSASTNDGRWYRQPLVWLLIAFPLAAVIGGVVTLILAIRSDDGLVADDYYRRGKEIHRVLARDDAARRYGISGEIHLGADGLMLKLERGRLTDWPARMTLRFLHATRAGYDRSIELESRAKGLYYAPFAPLTPGHWHAQLEADDWRLLGSLDAPASAQVHLAPAAR